MTTGTGQAVNSVVPIFGHRYIPSFPLEEGNPVFSVYQMDIIYYGYDLANYLSVEFQFVLPENFNVPDTPRRIGFWSHWAEAM